MFEATVDISYVISPVQAYTVEYHAVGRVWGASFKTVEDADAFLDASRKEAHALYVEAAAEAQAAEAAAAAAAEAAQAAPKSRAGRLFLFGVGVAGLAFAAVQAAKALRKG